MKLGGRLEPIMAHKGANDIIYASVLGNRLFTAEGAGGIGIYEIGADLHLTERGRVKIPDGKGVRQVVVPAPGRFALMHCGGSAIYIVDLQDPVQPRLVLSNPQVGLFYGDQLADKLFDNRYLVAHWHRSGPAWYDIGGPQPVLAGNTPDKTLYIWTDGACAYGDSLLITKNRKYFLLSLNERRNASELTGFGIAGVDLGGRPSTDGKRLAISSRHNRTVKVLDIADVARPKLTREYTLFGHPGACAFWNGRVLVPAGYQGLLLERKENAEKADR